MHLYGTWEKQKRRLQRSLILSNIKQRIRVTELKDFHWRIPLIWTGTIERLWVPHCLLNNLLWRSGLLQDCATSALAHANTRQGSRVQTWNETVCSSDLNRGGLAEAEGRLRWHVLAADLVAVQPQRLQPREVAHIHHTAEAPQGELWRNGTGRRLASRR